MSLLDANMVRGPLCIHCPRYGLFYPPKLSKSPPEGVLKFTVEPIMKSAALHFPPELSLNLHGGIIGCV